MLYRDLLLHEHRHQDRVYGERLFIYLDRRLMGARRNAETYSRKDELVDEYDRNGDRQEGIEEDHARGVVDIEDDYEGKHQETGRDHLRPGEGLESALFRRPFIELAYYLIGILHVDPRVLPPARPYQLTDPLARVSRYNGDYPPGGGHRQYELRGVDLLVLIKDQILLRRVFGEIYEFEPVVTGKRPVIVQSPYAACCLQYVAKAASGLFLHGQGLFYNLLIGQALVYEEFSYQYGLLMVSSEPYPEGALYGRALPCIPAVNVPRDP